MGSARSGAAAWLAWLAWCSASLKARALYVDQMGVSDWTLEHVGAVQRATFVGGQAVVGSRLGVVGSLKAAGGALEWRHALSDRGDVAELRSGGFAFVGQQSVGGKERRAVVAVSRDGCMARLWSASSGGLGWDARLCAGGLEGAVDAAVLPADLAGDASSFLLVLSRGHVQLLHGASGAASKQWRAPAGAQLEGLAHSSRAAFAFGRRDGALHAFEVFSGRAMVADKAQAGSRAVPVGALDGGEHAFLAFLQPGGELALLNLATGVTTGTGVKAPAGAEPAALSDDRAFPMLLLGRRVLAVSSSGVVSVAHEAAGAGWFAARGALSADSSAAPAGSLVVLSAELGLSCLSFSRGSVGAASAVSAFPDKAAGKGSRGQPAQLFVQASSTPGSARLLVSFQDESLVLVQAAAGSAAVLLFSREEALADVRQLAVVELPPLDHSVPDESLAEQIANAVAHGDVAFRVRDQVRALRESVQSVAAHAAHWIDLVVQTQGQILVQAYKGELPREEQGMSEAALANFGFRRGLLALTRAGKLLLLNSVDGSLIMGVFDPALAFAPQLAMYVTRARTAGPQHPAEVALVAPSRVSFRNALTGALLHEETPRAAIKESLLVEGEQLHAHELKSNHSSSGFSSSPSGKQAVEEDEFPSGCVVALTEGGAWQAFPPRLSGGPLLLKLHFAHLDRASKVLEGVALAPGGRAETVWSLVVPAGDEILLVAAHAGGAVNNPGLSKGDGAVLVKYLNPNLMLLVTRNAQGDVVATVLDGVSGRVVKRVSHRAASGPVHAVLFDHQVVYTYWSDSGKRTEMSVVQIFEGQVERRELNPWTKRGPDAVGARTAFSSFDPEQTTVQQRTFMLDRAVRALGVTTTRQGISDRRVLLAAEQGSINMLMRQFVDARRPLGKPSETEQLELLQQYFPVLPVIPTHTLTYNKTVARVSRVYSIPTRLESTTLIVAVGLDMFFTRALPSGGFDMLNEDFSYALLLLLLGGLSVATVVLSRLVKDKQLAMQWK